MSTSLPSRRGGREAQGAEADHRVDEAALLVLAAGGDHEAFARLYDATVARAFGTALRILEDVAQTEEVLQDAYLQLWRSSRNFDRDRSSAMTWILTIVHRHTVGRARAVENRSSREARLPLHHAPPTTSTDEPRAAGEAQAAYGVRHALATLSPTQRDAIELGYFGAFTQAEVAHRLDLPLDTVTARIRSGLHQLRGQLDHR